MNNRRVFTGVSAALLRGDRVVARLTSATGFTLGGVPQMTGTLPGRPSFWVAPGVALTFAWQVSNEQANAAWLEADATITTVADGRVSVRGTSPCRPHDQKDPAR